VFLLQMAGYPGSGKSTLSRKIAKAAAANQAVPGEFTF
jgi:tRNA uridine 5-carbamoylmethylation protein Kti12